MILNAVANSTFFKISKHANDNLTLDERSALKSLQQDKDIVICPADKRSSIVILDKEDYIAKCMGLLNDEKIYKKLDHDPTAEIQNCRARPT
jgi:hypothetical protein